MAEQDGHCRESFTLAGQRIVCTHPPGHAGPHEGLHTHGSFRWNPVGPRAATEPPTHVHLARTENDVPALPAPTSMACRARLDHEQNLYTCTRPTGHPDLHVSHDADPLGRHTVRAIWEAGR